MKIKLEPFATEPTRAHETDAGIDIYAMYDDVIGPLDFKAIRTGVHVEMPHGRCGLLVSKSGMMLNHGITSTGLIDEGYTGEIMVILVNHSNKPYMVFAGDKISQLVIMPVDYEPIEVVSDIQGGDRGDNGFGSTGK